MFHGSWFAMMAPLADISAGFVGWIIYCKFLHYKAREQSALLRGLGHEVSRDDAFGRMFWISIER